MSDAGSSRPGANQPTASTPTAEPQPTPTAEQELTDADRIRAAVLDCPDVADLSGGSFGEVASYLPGRSVPGVRVGDDHVDVHIVANFGSPLPEVADRIGRSVEPLLGGRRLRVSVDDIVLPGEVGGPSADTDRSSGTPAAR